MELKVLLKKDGSYHVVGIEDGEIFHTTMEKGDKLLPYKNYGEFSKPKYNPKSESWEESATSEEIKHQETQRLSEFLSIWGLDINTWIALNKDKRK